MNCNHFHCLRTGHISPWFPPLNLPQAYHMLFCLNRLLIAPLFQETFVHCLVFPYFIFMFQPEHNACKKPFIREVHHSLSY